MRSRKKPLGDKNTIGAQVTKIRQEKNMTQLLLVARLQVEGMDISPSSHSKLEGQIRMVTDIEAMTIAWVLDVPIGELFPKDRQIPVNHD